MDTESDFELPSTLAVNESTRADVMSVQIVKILFI
jgi:hypothetical protein